MLDIWFLFTLQKSRSDNLTCFLGNLSRRADLDFSYSYQSTFRVDVSLKYSEMLKKNLFVSFTSNGAIVFIFF